MAFNYLPVANSYEDNGLYILGRIIYDKGTLSYKRCAFLAFLAFLNFFCTFLHFFCVFVRFHLKVAALCQASRLWVNGKVIFGSRKQDWGEL